MELASQKRQLLTLQQEERVQLKAALDQLNTEFQKELDHYRRLAQMKAYTQEMTRSHRYHEEKGFWEYINFIVERIHLYTWHKTVMATCTAKYRKSRLILEEEFRGQQVQHRKEKIRLRYSCLLEPISPPPDLP